MRKSAVLFGSILFAFNPAAANHRENVCNRITDVQTQLPVRQLFRSGILSKSPYESDASHNGKVTKYIQTHFRMKFLSGFIGLDLDAHNYDANNRRVKINYIPTEMLYSPVHEGYTYYSIGKHEWNEKHNNYDNDNAYNPDFVSKHIDSLNIAVEIPKPVYLYEGVTPVNLRVPKNEDPKIFLHLIKLKIYGEISPPFGFVISDKVGKSRYVPDGYIYYARNVVLKPACMAFIDGISGKVIKTIDLTKKKHPD